LRKKDSLHEEKIISDLISDNLSDVPADTFSDTDSESKSETQRENVTSERECETGSKGSDDSANISNAGATTWIKVNKTPNLVCSTGNSGVKQIPSEPTKVLEIIELFFGDYFFEMLSKETNQYYFQNQEKYYSSSMGLKWVDVSVVCPTHKRSKFCFMPLSQRYHPLTHY
jgi:hypothetical protein